MCLTKLGNFIAPIRILVEVSIIHRTVLIVGNLDNVRSYTALRRIEISFLQHHGVFVAIKHFHTFRLPGTGKTIRKVYTCLTSAATTGFDFNYTVSTAGTPNSSSRSILQNVDTLNILRVHRKQACELLAVVHILKVNVGRIITFKHVSVNDDQRFLITVDSCNTTQTHCCTRTEVTGIHHNIQTGNLSLKRLVGSFERQALHFVHVQGLCSNRYLFCRNGKAVGFLHLLSFYSNTLQLGLTNHFYAENFILTYYLRVRLVSYIRNLELIFSVFHRHGKVTINIGSGSFNDTVVLV